MTREKKIVIDLSLVVSRLNNFYVRNVDFLPIFQEKKNIYIIYNIYRKNRDTNFVISDINNLKQNIMTIAEAKQVLRDNGYFVDNLWHVNDVQTNFECDEETAQNILYWALTSPTTIEEINNEINRVATNENLNTNGI